MVKVLPHVMRNINEFNIPAGDEFGYEILYFGVNDLIWCIFDCSHKSIFKFDMILVQSMDMNAMS